MTDVVIRRCTLRIVRHGGWSWGPDRRALLAQATSALPELIAERLAELLPDVDGEIDEPVCLRFSLRAGQIFNDQTLANAILEGLTPASLPIAGLLARSGSEAPEVRAAGEREESVGAPADVERIVAPPSFPARPLQLLLQWRNQAELWQRLQGFSFRALGLWLHSVLEELPEFEAPAELAHTLREECLAIRASLPSDGDIWMHVAQARLAIAVELVARHERAVTANEILTLLEELAPLPEGEVPMSEPSPSPDGVPEESSPPANALATTRRVVVPHASGRRDESAQTDTEVKLCSVLPFLALGALHRLGWLDVAAATFRALRDAGNGATFAAALACKLLPAPARGWYRTEEVSRTAAAFAGLRAAPSHGELGRWGHRVGQELSPLDDFVIAELARGHEMKMPLLIMRVESRYSREWLLFDADGGFPITWQRDEAAILRHLRRFGPCVVMVSTGAATRSLMQGLAQADRSFVTTAMPSRDDNWQRIRGTPCWTGDPQTFPPKLMDAAAMLPQIEAQALSVTRDLVELRPAAPSDTSEELEYSAALAAATGLGAIAWTLWRERETVHPLLALERFANLDGTARTTPGAVEIRPSFGRRYLDLQKHGLLADIPAPPWLDGRRVVFVGP